MVTNSLTTFTGVLLEDKMPELDSESALKARFRIKKLKKLLRKKQKSFKRTGRRLREMEGVFNAHNKNELDQLREIEDDISILRARLKVLEIEEAEVWPEDDEDPEIKELEGDHAARFAEERGDVENESYPDLEEEEKLVELVREAKLLYRKIAGAWGPGRAENRQQIDWFIEATIAYKARDLSTLQHLHKILKFGLEAVLASDLLFEIERLESEIANVELQSKEEHFDLLKVYRVFIQGVYGREKAKQASRQVVCNRIRTSQYIVGELETRIERLLSRRRAREKVVEDLGDPFASVEPTIGFWKF